MRALENATTEQEAVPQTWLRGNRQSDQAFRIHDVSWIKEPVVIACQEQSRQMSLTQHTLKGTSWN